ncbi:hypothetical protein [Desulfosarcina ovata]|uniref:STAS domain-containing protein n=2 Tax=Desulfosarcina ovata TaxID=83564 RepID=A0A5K8AN07_9BACT|nr:hypothetical protein [Desulfosarcina ovata]BBO86068.1 hypothetical protein DSCO28_66340 [Desulfosarcina ovata subsp. sediminis]BBO93004.1 hypothetical protein DSCOOX_61840 [Desulfosarcina ovata subsp. ovata]
MAKNFRVCTKDKGKKNLALRLYGDFDASSACELINILNTGLKKNRKVAIDTNGLRTISPFGLDLFIPRMTSLNSGQVDIEMTGRFSHAFQEE